MNLKGFCESQILWTESQILWKTSILVNFNVVLVDRILINWRNPKLKSLNSMSEYVVVYTGQFPAKICLGGTKIIAYLPTFGRLNPESSQHGKRMPFRNVLIFPLNNLPRLPLSLVLFICPSPVSISFPLSLTDRHHWHWYKR